jgi:hypothetical protein
VYSYCNICKPDLLCNIYMKHLQHTSETSEIFETYACNMRFQQNKAGRRANEELHSRIRLCGHDGEEGWQRVGSCMVPGERCPARGGGGSSSRAGVALRSEAIVAVWSRGSMLLR